MSDICHCCWHSILSEHRTGEPPARIQQCCWCARTRREVATRFIDPAHGPHQPISYRWPEEAAKP